MKIKKTFLFTVVPLLLGLGCWVAYAIIGSEVAANGTLVEPFALIPLGYIFVALGLVVGIILLFTRFKNEEPK
jgi:uncharacterized BrkB/YihY/UPF0761 family membrane protein